MIRSTTNMVSWHSRYPDLAFLLSLFPYKEKRLQSESGPFEDWLQGIDLDEIELLYIVGLIDFSLPEKVSNWLQSDQKRALVFIEEDLGAFAAFSQEKMLENPQVHFHYSDGDPTDALADMFPTDRLAVFEGKAFDGALLKRKSAAVSALYSDVLYSHKIVENVLFNFKRLNGAFDGRGKFEGIPAVICGAGPSLAKDFSMLGEIKDKALIFGGGSAITVLTENGVQPHFAIALDPNDEEYDRLHQASYFEGPFLLAPRLHHGVLNTTNGPFGYLKSDTGGIVENYLEEELGIEGDPIGPDLGEEAFSVTTLAISHAYAMGCNPIILLGVDLAYTGGVRYAAGVEAKEDQTKDPRALEEKIVRKGIGGEKVETLLKWVMESDCISAFAKNHRDVEMVNATGGGLGFKGMKNVSLEKIFSKRKSQDLSGLIHQWIQSSPLNFEHEKIGEILIRLENSLWKCDELCLEIIHSMEEESSRLALFEIDLQEEMAYQWLLEGIDLALSRILFRYYPHLDPEEGKKACDLAKYNEMKLQIQKFIRIVEKVKE